MGTQYIASANSSTVATANFNQDERHVLQALRTRFKDGQDCFAPQELARLRFMRWLYRTRRLTP